MRRFQVWADRLVVEYFELDCKSAQEAQEIVEAEGATPLWQEPATSPVLIDIKEKPIIK